MLWINYTITNCCWLLVIPKENEIILWSQVVLVLPSSEILQWDLLQNVQNQKLTRNALVQRILASKDTPHPSSLSQMGYSTRKSATQALRAHDFLPWQQATTVTVTVQLLAMSLYTPPPGETILKSRSASCWRTSDQDRRNNRKLLAGAPGRMTSKGLVHGVVVTKQSLVSLPSLHPHLSQGLLDTPARQHATKWRKKEAVWWKGTVQ